MFHRSLVTFGALIALAPACLLTPRAAAAQVYVRPDAVVVRLSAGVPRVSGVNRLEAPSPGLASLARRLELTFERQFPDPPGASTPGARPSEPGDRADLLRIATLASRLERYWIVHLGGGVAAADAVRLLREQPDVESAETIALVSVESMPDDSLWSFGYHLYQPSRKDVHAPEAWEIATGQTARIAIIDTGVLLTHPDLAGPGPGIGGNIWTNPAEANGIAGVDDDENGYIDDLHGWDFIDLDAESLVVEGEDWRDEDPDPNDFVGHGTGVAGIAAALTNNRIGVAGGCPDGKIVPLRCGFSARIQPAGLIDQSAVSRAIVYAARAGVDVINCSFSSVPQASLWEAMDYAFTLGTIVVVAAGNNNSFHFMADRIETIAVTGLDADDRLAGFASLGSYVDLAAAGSFVATTSMYRDDKADSATRAIASYAVTASGTSFSAPIAAAAVAMIQADRRGRGWLPLTPYVMRWTLMGTSDDISHTNPGISGYGAGRVNYHRALLASIENPNGTIQTTPNPNPGPPGSPPPDPPPHPGDSHPPFPINDLTWQFLGRRSIVMHWTAPGDWGGGPIAAYRLYSTNASYPGHPLELNSLYPLPYPGSDGASQEARIEPLAEGSTMAMSLVSVDTAGNLSPFSNVVTVQIPAVRPAPIVDLRVLEVNDRSVTLEWTASGDDSLTGMATRYLVRAARHPIDVNGFDSADGYRVVSTTGRSHETMVWQGLALDRPYWFAIKAVDAYGFASAISNNATTWADTLPSPPGSGPSPNVAMSLASANPTRSPVTMVWRRGPARAGEPARIDVFDVMGRHRRELPVGAGAEGVAIWNGLDDSGVRVGAGVYLARFTSGNQVVRARVVVLD